MNRAILTVTVVLSVTGCAPPVHEPTEPTVRHTDREVISTDRAPAAIGPYSQAIRVGDTLYVSGQIAIDPATGEMVRDGIEAETRQVLTNIRNILEAAGFKGSDVVQSKVFLADLDDYAAMNAIYAETFGESPPARAAVQVARLPLDARVEIMVVAVKDR